MVKRRRPICISAFYRWTTECGKKCNSNSLSAWRVQYQCHQSTRSWTSAIICQQSVFEFIFTNDMFSELDVQLVLRSEMSWNGKSKTNVRMMKYEKKNEKKKEINLTGKSIRDQNHKTKETNLMQSNECIQVIRVNKQKRKKRESEK